MKMKEKMTSIIRFRRFVLKLRKCMLLLQNQQVRRRPSILPPPADESDDVRLHPGHEAGHFAVSATNGTEEEKRFMVNLRQLSNPAFLKLLERSKDEFGESFRHEGALAIPCKADELEKILEDEDYCLELGN